MNRPSTHTVAESAADAEGAASAGMLTALHGAPAAAAAAASAGARKNARGLFNKFTRGTTKSEAAAAAPMDAGAPRPVRGGGDEDKALRTLIELAGAAKWGADCVAAVQAMARTTAWPGGPLSDADFARQSERRDVLVNAPGSVPALLAALRSGSTEIVLATLKVLLNLVQANFADRPLTPATKRLDALAKAGIVPLLLQLLGGGGDGAALKDDRLKQLLTPVAKVLWSMVENDTGRESFVSAGGVETFARILKQRGKDYGRTAVVGVLHHVALESRLFERVAVPDVLEGLVGACRDLNEQLNRRALIALKTFSANHKCAARLVQLKAHEWLIPLVAAADSSIAFLAACLIVDLREGSPANRAVVDQSGALEDVERFFHGYDVMFFSETTRYRAQTIEYLRELLSAERDPIVRLSGGWQALACCVTIEKVPETRALLMQPDMLRAITSLCLAPDVWLYRLGVQCLRRLDLHVPTFNGGGSKGGASALGRPLRQWSEDDVAAWAAEQRFSTYASLFQNGWVDGDLLLDTTDEDLVKLGVANPMHRKRILRAVAELEAAAAQDGAGKAAASAAVPRIVGPAAPQHAYDVFVSYRRSNGSQLAQLIKVHLRFASMSVFLDVDELGAGAFDTRLVQKLHASRCLVLVLTKGALDRCISATGADETDWMRCEIATALVARKPIIPVAFDFEWPAADKLPADIRAVVSNNAVNWSHEYMDAAIDRIIQFVRASASGGGA